MYEIRPVKSTQNLHNFLYKATTSTAMEIKLCAVNRSKEFQRIREAIAAVKPSKAKSFSDSIFKLFFRGTNDRIYKELPRQTFNIIMIRQSFVFSVSLVRKIKNPLIKFNRDSEGNWDMEQNTIVEINAEMSSTK